MTMTTKATELNIPAITKICKAHDIVSVKLFGSFADSSQHAESDIDLLVRFAHQKSLLEIVRIKREFTEALGVEVDLVTERAISPYLRDEILNTSKVIYEAA